MIDSGYVGAVKSKTTDKHCRLHSHGRSVSRTWIERRSVRPSVLISVLLLLIKSIAFTTYKSYILIGAAGSENITPLKLGRISVIIDLGNGVHKIIV